MEIVFWWEENFFPKISPKNENARMDQLDKLTDVIDSKQKVKDLFICTEISDNNDKMSI